jgi:hypothetical protein
MKCLTTVVIVSVFFTMAASPPTADDADPTGTWTWSTGMKTGSPSIYELTLKRVGDKLTGSMFDHTTTYPNLGKVARDQIKRNTSQRIIDGRFDNGQISFKVSRTLNGRYTTVKKFTAKIDGKKLVGTIQVNEQKPSAWEATRVEQ